MWIADLTTCDKHTESRWKWTRSHLYPNFIMGWVDTTKYLSRFHQDCVSHCKSVAFQGRINAFFYIVLKDTQIMLYPMWNQQLKSEIMPSPKGRRLSCNRHFLQVKLRYCSCNFGLGKMAVKNGAIQPGLRGYQPCCPAQQEAPLIIDIGILAFFCEFGFRGESLAGGNPLRSRSYPNNDSWEKVKFNVYM